MRSAKATDGKRQDLTPLLCFANGYLDELGYERGTIDTSLPFPELRARSEITAKAQAADQDPAFSQRIREGLPGQR